MATNLYNLFKTLPFPVSHTHFWLRHRCFLPVSSKALFLGCISGIGAFFWISPEPSSLCPLQTLHSLPCVWTLLVPVAFACFCTLLMFNISFGCCRHNVSNTFVQLTEGRSARDQPKQPPAKKRRPGACQGVGIEGWVKQGDDHLGRKRGRGRDRNWHSGRP